MDHIESIKKKLAEANQFHLWHHFESLPSEEEKNNFIRQLEAVGNFKLIGDIFKESMRVIDEGIEGEIQPPTESDFTNISDLDLSLIDVGYERLAKGEVAVLILAGGSGTRLGQTIPKGMFVCPTLIQQKSLFQLQCEKIRRLEQITCEKMSVTKITIPLLYMTSEQTDSPTRSFFEEHNYFGLLKEQIFFFTQSSIPSLSLDGRILIRNSTELCNFPGGNAGVYTSLADSGVLSRIDALGVKYVQVFTVDNMLCKLGDPIFTGYAHANKFDVVVKACPKASDHEAVGVFAKRGAKWGVVEYTEIGKERAEAKHINGKRVFDAANIAIFLYSIDFLKRVAEVMKSYTYYHIAKKPIPTINGIVEGVKLEAFIFDLFEYARNFSILSVNRSDEFSGIKNCDDEGHTKTDTPYTAVNDLHALHWRWIKEGSAKLAGEGFLGLESKVNGGVEISPLVSYAGEGITANILTYIAGELRKGVCVSVDVSILSNL